MHNTENDNDDEDTPRSRHVMHNRCAGGALTFCGQVVAPYGWHIVTMQEACAKTNVLCRKCAETVSARVISQAEEG